MLCFLPFLIKALDCVGFRVNPRVKRIKNKYIKSIKCITYSIIKTKVDRLVTNMNEEVCTRIYSINIILYK